MGKSMKERQNGEILEQNKPRVSEFRGQKRIEGGSEVLYLLWCNLGSRLATAEAKNRVYACVLITQQDESKCHDPYNTVAAELRPS